MGKLLKMTTTIDRKSIVAKLEECTNETLLDQINKLLEKERVEALASNIFSVEVKPVLTQKVPVNYDHLTVDEFMDLMRLEAKANKEY